MRGQFNALEQLACFLIKNAQGEESERHPMLFIKRNLSWIACVKWRFVRYVSIMSGGDKI